jgi:hypothetical protein
MGRGEEGKREKSKKTKQQHECERMKGKEGEKSNITITHCNCPY